MADITACHPERERRENEIEEGWFSHPIDRIA